MSAQAPRGKDQGIPEERHAEIEQNEWRKQDWCPENPTGNSCLLAGHVLSIAIAPLLGHSDRATTERYTHLVQGYPLVSESASWNMAHGKKSIATINAWICRHQAPAPLRPR